MKALSIFSGGLDSILATLHIKSLGIEVQPVFLKTPFFTPENAIKSAENIKVPLKIIDITDLYFELLKGPKHGFGGNMNPCIDCHALMLRIAGEMLVEEKADFLISGEVLGQRPMSQNRRSLSIVENESTMSGLVLRPLSAKLLPKTTPELNGWINREDMLDISGRSRKRQMAMAKELNVTNYPAPAGGCLLTDPIFSRRLKDIMDNSLVLEKDEIELLKLGRHFRITPDTKIIVGRNKAENERILKLAGEKGSVLHTINVPGPVVFVSGKRSDEIDHLAASMTISYSDAKEKTSEIALIYNGNKQILEVKGENKNTFKHYMI